MKKISILVCAAILVSCQAQWRGELQQQKSRYVGRPIDSLYDEWGAPLAVAPKMDGGRYAEFHKFVRGYECELKVTTDRSLTIVKVALGGQNGCVTPI